jgi:predicted Fe-S protein YdhL (DUF1289 family)
MDEETGFCRGCMRTMQEITEWERYGDEQRKIILQALVSRRRETRATSNEQ